MLLPPLWHITARRILYPLNSRSSSCLVIMSATNPRLLNTKMIDNHSSLDASSFGRQLVSWSSIW